MLTKKNLMVFAVITLAFCLGLMGSVLGQGLKIYPQNFNLNSEGILEPVRADIDVCFTEGYVLTGYDMNLSVNGVPVVDADLVEYRVDELTGVGMFWAEFDRAVIRAYCLEEKLYQDEGATFGVTGWLEMSDGTNTEVINFTETNYINIFAPGNKLDLIM